MAVVGLDRVPIQVDRGRAETADGFGELRVLVRTKFLRPVAELAVAPRPYLSGDEHVMAAWAKTDEDGVVVFSVVPGRYQIVALSMEWEGAWQVNEGATTEVVLEVAGTQELFGRAVDEHGFPVAGAGIYVSVGERVKDAMQSQLTDGQGCFRLQVYGESGWVAAQKDDRASLCYPVAALLSGRYDIVVDQVTVEVAGRVTGADAPLPGADISVGVVDNRSRGILSTPHGSHRLFVGPLSRARSDSEGRFAVRSFIGPVTLFVLHPGHARYSQALVLEEGVGVSVECKLVAPKRVAGRVRFADGADAGGVYVSVRERDGSYYQSVTDSAGRFAIEGVAGQEVDVYCETDEYECKQSIRIEESKADLDMVLQRTYKVSGVFLGGGREGMRVATRSGGDWTERGACDKEGKFTVWRVPNVPHDIVVYLERDRLLLGCVLGAMPSGRLLQVSGSPFDMTVSLLGNLPRVGVLELVYSDLGECKQKWAIHTGGSEIMINGVCGFGKTRFAYYVEGRQVSSGVCTIGPQSCLCIGR